MSAISESYLQEAYVVQLVAQRKKKENIQRSTLRLLILMISAELQELNAEC